VPFDSSRCSSSIKFNYQQPSSNDAVQQVHDLHYCPAYLVLNNEHTKFRAIYDSVPASLLIQGSNGDDKLCKGASILLARLYDSTSSSASPTKANTDKAHALLGELLVQKIDDTLRAQILLRKLAVMDKAGDIGSGAVNKQRDALQYCQTIQNTDKRIAYPLYIRAKIMYSNEKYKEALELIERYVSAASTTPSSSATADNTAALFKFPEYYTLHASILSKLGRKSNAQALYALAQSSFPSDTSIKLDLGYFLIDTRQYQQALELARSLDHPLLMAIAQYHLQQYSDAISTLQQRVLKQTSLSHHDLYLAHYHIAACQFKLHRYDKVVDSVNDALSAYNSASGGSTASVESVHDLAVLKCGSQLYTASVRDTKHCLSRAMTHFPKSAELLFQLAHLELLARNALRAAQLFRNLMKQIASDNQYTELYYSTLVFENFAAILERLEIKRGFEDLLPNFEAILNRYQLTLTSSGGSDHRKQDSDNTMY